MSEHVSARLSARYVNTDDETRLLETASYTELYQNICFKYNKFCAINNTSLYFMTEMELRNKEEEMKYFSNFIFKAIFYIM